MRVAAILVAILLIGTAVPSGLRAERSLRTGATGRLIWESARCLLAVAAATALLITVLWSRA